jgi:DNA-binding LacI/PurR family transcriptional regulator
MNSELNHLTLNRSKGKRKPVYQQVVQYLKNAIESNNISTGQHLQTVAEYANTLKVGYSTIDTAFEVLEQDGLISRNTKRGKGPIVLGCNKGTINFTRWRGCAIFISMAEGIEEYARENKIKVVITDAMQNSKRYLDMISHAPNDADGLILFPWDTPDYNKAVTDAVKSGTKIVFIDRIISNMDLSSVSIDHFGGAYQATWHLIETHNCPVYYVGYTDKPSSSYQRYKGWLEAMKQYRCDLEYQNYVCEFFKSEAETAAMPDNEWMQPDCDKIIDLFKTKQQEKYCFFTFNDDAAVLIYKAAQKEGLEIGKDVFIASFGDSPYCKNLAVPLTSVSQFDREVGYEAAKLLHYEIKGICKHSMHKILPAKLNIRQSSTGKNSD